MGIIPVLDILNGVVVRGIAGRRHEYQPIVSQLTPSTRPLDVATALVTAYRPPALYVADLDAILHQRFALALYQQLTALGVPVWVDAGATTPEQAATILDTGCALVAGLEVLPDEAAFRSLVANVPLERVLFSLDLRDGLPWHTWGGTALDIVARVVALDVLRVIVLDLTRVGTGTGPGPRDLLQELRTRFPTLELIAAGGVNSVADLEVLRALGIDGVLVASALHDGRFASFVR